MKTSPPFCLCHAGIASFICAFLVTFTSMASAQDYGSITGTVSSYGNNPVPIEGVRVTALSELYSYSSLTGTDGMYTIGQVETGIYTLTAEKEGYIGQTVEDVDWDVIISVHGCDNEPLIGAQVIICHDASGDCDTLYTGQGGGVSYVMTGGYITIEIIYDDYPPYYLYHIPVFNNLTIPVILCPACPSAQDFQVNLEGEATWYPPSMDDELVFHEGFESGLIPFGWSQEYVTGDIDWTVTSGNPSGTPNKALQGIYNAAFYGDTGTTILITPWLDLHDAVNPKLTFYHIHPSEPSINELKVMYRNYPTGPWHNLAGYIYGDTTWHREVIELPDPTDSYQIGFVGMAKQPGGLGICIDSVIVKKAAYPYVNTDPTLTGYEVYLDGVLQDTTSATHYSYQGLDPGSYHIAGSKATYETCTSLLLEYPFHYLPCEFLEQPDNFVGSIDGLTVTLSWDPPTGYGKDSSGQVNDTTYTLLGYNIYRNNQLLNEDPVTELQYSDVVVPDGFYYYNVTAVYAGNGFYAESCFIDPSYEAVVCCIFAAPGNLVAEVQNFNNVALVWHSPDTTELPLSMNSNEDRGANRYVMTGYYVWRDEWRIAYIPPIDTEYLDPAITPGTHVYRVTAVYDEGESLPSNEVTVEILPRGHLKGYVRDGMTWDAIPGATVLLNPSGLTATTGEDGSYQFEYITTGNYEVTAQAEGYNPTTLEQVKVYNNQVTKLNIPVYTGTATIYSLPFTETWYEGTFDSHAWSFFPSTGSWYINTSEGNPPPSAGFSYSPAMNYFENSLVSPVFDARTITDLVWLSFDITRDNPGGGSQENMRIEVWGDTSWVILDEIVGQGWSWWQHVNYVISSYAKGKLFKVRFTATGDDSYPVGSWGIDNISLYRTQQALLEGIVTELAGGEPVSGATVTVAGYPPAASDATGYYAVHADEGTYTVTCEASGYNPVETQLDISDITTWDVQLTQPVMTVDPQSLYQVYDPLTSDTMVFTQPLTINNDGNGPLEWDAVIEYFDPTGTGGVPAEDGWLTLDALQGTVEAGNQQEVTATFNAEGLSGDYSYQASVTFNSSPDVGQVVVIATFDVLSGINTITDDDRITIYPNPSKEVITIHSTVKIKSLRIMNYPGQVVHVMTEPIGNKFDIPIPGLSDGMYLIEFIMNDRHTVISKIVIKH